MKHFITLLLFIGMMFSVQSQDLFYEPEDKYNRTYLGFTTSPGAYDDGANFGLQFAAHLDLNLPVNLYLGIEVFYFPNLNGFDYSHYLGSIGVSYLTNQNKKFEIYTAIKLGEVHRFNNRHGSLGFESGIRYQLGRSPFYIGTKGVLQYRTDTIGRDPNYWRESIHVELLIRIN